MMMKSYHEDEMNYMYYIPIIFLEVSEGDAPGPLVELFETDSPTQ